MGGENGHPYEDYDGYGEQGFSQSDEDDAYASQMQGGRQSWGGDAKPKNVNHTKDGGALDGQDRRARLAHTLHTYCDTGQTAYGAKSTGEQKAEEEETRLLEDLTDELAGNSIDEIVKQTFSFYVCVRWMPDAYFSKLAKAELAVREQMAKASEDAGVPKDEANVDEVLDSNRSDAEKIASLYQSFRFVPLLCSRNFDVYARVGADGTHFGVFESDTENLRSWLDNKNNSDVINALIKTEKDICDTTDKAMTGCPESFACRNIVGNWVPGRSYFCDKNEEERQKSLLESFENFDNRLDDSDKNDWHEKFPFQSFIMKEPWESNGEGSPLPGARFSICFGKRVASDLHRRPLPVEHEAGSHLLTDQNNVGCNGFYTINEVQAELKRLVDLWKPPTCQLAEVQYTVKKELVKRFAEMNKQLFDALPSMVNDEIKSEMKGTLADAHANNNTWLAPASLDTDGMQFVDGMKVRQHDAKFGFGSANVVGEVKIQNNNVHVLWPGKTDAQAVSPKSLEILPRDWDNKGAWHPPGTSGLASLASFWRRFRGKHEKRMTHLAKFMSGSTSKWAVCQVKTNADPEALDALLGDEDTAFQDFQREAYSRWVPGPKQPGTDCREIGDFLKGARSEQDARATQEASSMAGCLACKLVDMKKDFVEKYRGENFICPEKAPMDPAEQLLILKKQSNGDCYLRMTQLQQQKNNWHYQGKFPARKQYEAMQNIPSAEFELVQIQDVSGNGKEATVKVGRYCTFDELQLSERFCTIRYLNGENQILSALSNASASLQAMAGTPSSVAAIAGATDKQEVAKAMAKNLVQRTVDAGIEGTRYAAASGASALLDGFRPPPGFARIRKQLGERLEAKYESGELLHALSFQKFVGKHETTTNSKPTYERYIVRHPCRDFDSTQILTDRLHWSGIVLRMVIEASKSFPNAKMLEQKQVKIRLSGESLQWTKQLLEGQTDTKNYPFASMAVGEDVLPVGDRELTALVATGDQKRHLSAFTLKLSCISKSSLGSRPRGNKDSSKFDECLKNGIATNARLHAKEPWKLSFREEVVVHAEFSENRSPATLAVKKVDLAKKNNGPSTMTSGWEYQQAFFNTKTPANIPQEIFLKPEDILEALGILQASNVA
eukprot:TRINITY_DN6526_c0_g1_i1.p1 TRINITY_DN6526_c0_g1~~TRINITY_DN6526_c0_g1_i1.p1  ORF type:complete len:1307 (-),score=156.30 TRINITY_DN6526_c0_g1_i1:241-3609(-)